LYRKNTFVFPFILFQSKYPHSIHFIFLFICFLFTVSNLSALSGVFAGLGLEGNANTREGIALGGNLSGGVDLDNQFSLGLKMALSSNMDTVTTLEPAVFFRYYLPLKISGFFAQAELGTAIYIEDNKNYPAFLAGLVFGWHYNVGKNWYIEPSIRGGYPFAWGVGFLVGLHFDK